MDLKQKLTLMYWGSVVASVTIGSFLAFVILGLTTNKLSLNLDDIFNRNNVSLQYESLSKVLCSDARNISTCSCGTKYTGATCELYYLCANKPCHNGGHCIKSSGDGIHCSCKSGYNGKRCETNIDECIGVTCYNNGSCIDGVDSYVCSCVAGYQGDHCTTEINECQSNPCITGDCIDQLNAFYCFCPAGRTGRICEKLTATFSKKMSVALAQQIVLTVHSNTNTYVFLKIEYANNALFGLLQTTSTDDIRVSLVKCTIGNVYVSLVNVHEEKYGKQTYNQYNSTTELHNIPRLQLIAILLGTNLQLYSYILIKKADNLTLPDSYAMFAYNTSLLLCTKNNYLVKYDILRKRLTKYANLNQYIHLRATSITQIVLCIASEPFAILVNKHDKQSSIHAITAGFTITNKPLQQLVTYLNLLTIHLKRSFG